MRRGQRVGGCGSAQLLVTLGALVAVLGAVPRALAQTFVPIGPGPVSGFGGAAGRAADVVCSRFDQFTYFVASADGGIWRTRDGGVTWTALTDTMPTTATGAVALDPSNEQIVYAGSGEASFANHSRYGLGLYKSTDGGDTWSVLAASTFAGRCFSRIIVHPTSGNIIYAAIAGAGGGPERFGAKEHPQRTGPMGVFKSIDGGVSWTLLSGGLPALDATDVHFDPVDPSTLYAGIGHVYGNALNGIYKSTDAGATWTRLEGGLPAAGMGAGAGGRVNFAIAPSNRNRIYAYFAVPATGIGVGGSASGGGQQLGAFRSDDAGATWTQLTALPNIMSVQGFYNIMVIVHPTNPDRAFFGGVNLRRTDDAGATFSGNLGQHHPDVHGAAFDAAGRLVIANDGGICRSTNTNFSNYQALNIGMQSHQFYAGISTHPTDNTLIFGGLQDNGTVRRSPAAFLWDSVVGGDGGWTQVNQSDPLIVYAQFQGSGNLYRSTDGGTSFNPVGSGLTGRHAFLPPYLVDQSSPNRILWPNERVFESLDGGSTFVAISDDLTTGSPFAIRAMAMAPANPQVVYVVTSDSRFLRSVDGGRTFSLKLTDAFGWPRVTREITVDPNDSATVYLAGARFGRPHLRRSRDGGDTWETLDGDLPDRPAMVVELDTRYPTPRIYLGTDAGVYTSANGGANWSRLDPAFPSVGVIDLKLEPARPGTPGLIGGRLIAATQGRGAWIAHIPCPADFNADGAINPDDLGDYINCYFGPPGCAGADFNGDTEANPDDLGDFINVYFGGRC